MEIGLDRDGRRWALVAFAENVDDECPLTGDDTWLVSEWLVVTAASIIGVARASPKAGAHFELLGRSVLINPRPRGLIGPMSN